MVHRIGQLAVGASLMVILANSCMKSFEKSMQKRNEQKRNKTPDMTEMCIDCNRQVTFVSLDIMVAVIGIKKFSDTALILVFLNCAPLHYKKMLFKSLYLVFINVTQ